jgi:hypothetical protein
LLTKKTSKHKTKKERSQQKANSRGIQVAICSHNRKITSQVQSEAGHVRRARFHCNTEIPNGFGLQLAVCSSLVLGSPHSHFEVCVKNFYNYKPCYKMQLQLSWHRGRNAYHAAT